MSSLSLHLLSSRQSPKRQRAHFSLWSPYPNRPSGTKIHVTGTPFTGYALEFKRNYNPSLETERFEMFEIGAVDEKYMYDYPEREGEEGTVFVEKVARCEVEKVAEMIPPPGKCRDVFAPVDETLNRRCQEWTVDFVKRLVELGFLESTAEAIVQSKRDSPTHGIVGLRLPDSQS